MEGQGWNGGRGSGQHNFKKRILEDIFEAQIGKVINDSVNTKPSKNQT